MGKTITHMGALGTGGFTKLANQIIVAINLTAIGEALVFGTKAERMEAKPVPIRWMDGCQVVRMAEKSWKGSRAESIASLGISGNPRLVNFW